MGNIIFKILKEKKDAEGKYPVFLSYQYNGKRLRIYTKEKCLEKQWDPANQRFKRNYPGYQEANGYLDSLEEKVKKAHREYMAKGIIPSTDMIKNEVLPEETEYVPKQVSKQGVATYNLFELFEEFIQSARIKGRAYNTIRNYISLRNHLKAFEEYSGLKLAAETYNLRTHDKLLQYLVYEEDQAPNTVFGVVKNLKVFLNFLTEERNISLLPEVDKIKASYIDPEKIYLTWEELEKLQAVELRENLDKVRDVYLFSCYTGLRYSDLKNLHPAHIVERGNYKVVSLVQQKTQAKVEFALNAYALAILEKYKGKYLRCLPVIVNQKMNSHLKEIGQLAGINSLAEKLTFDKGQPLRTMVPKHELLTVHTARHTFATQSLLKGMTVEVLQKILGHKKIQNTLVYAKIVDDFKHQMMLNVWNG